MIELQGRPVLVVGLGLSGLAAARFLAGRGAEVWATDIRPAENLGPGVGELEKLGIRLFLGGHSNKVLAGRELIVVSPGVRLDQAWLQDAAAAGVEIIGEMGLAAQFVETPLVAVTGTNGKSTTCALIAELLQASGRSVFLGGNIGRPLTELLLGGETAEVAVVEVSSFQLETMPRFNPRVAAVLNLAPDHLDRHADFATYAGLKARIWADLSAEDALIVNAGDAYLLSLAKSARARRYLFGLAPFEGPGAFSDGRVARLRLADGFETSFDLSAWALPGRHNLENLLAALLAAQLAGGSPAGLSRGLAGFKALPHRLELVRRLDGVDYFNDSKATNTAAASLAVGGFDRPIILIAGGLDKGLSYEPLAAAARGRVREAILIGQTAEALAQTLEGVCPVHRAAGLVEAVGLARSLARPGEVVLLAPACASFDQFDNYVHRGRVFARAVEEL